MKNDTAATRLVARTIRSWLEFLVFKAREVELRFVLVPEALLPLTS